MNVSKYLLLMTQLYKKSNWIFTRKLFCTRKPKTYCMIILQFKTFIKILFIKKILLFENTCYQILSPSVNCYYWTLTVPLFELNPINSWGRCIFVISSILSTQNSTFLSVQKLFVKNFQLCVTWRMKAVKI